MRPARALRAATAALVLLAAAGCVGGGGGRSDGAFRVSAVEGSVIARIPGNEAKELRRGDAVPIGSVVRTSGTAVVRLEGSGGHVVELQGDQPRGDTQATLVEATRVSLQMGSALGLAGEGEAFTVESRSTVVAVAATGQARVERLLGVLRVGVYRGSARTELLGRGVDVPALKEVLITGGVPLERAPRPLTLSPADRWDRMLLGDVLDFDQELTQFGIGFNSEFGDAGRPQFFAAFVSVSSLGFLRPELPTGEPAELLVGVVFAAQLAARGGGPDAVPGLFQELIGLRDQGASWGLIAKEKGLDLRLLLEAVLDAIRRGTAPPPPPGTSGGVGSGGGSGSGNGNGNGNGGSTPNPSPSPDPDPSPDPSPSPSPSPDDDCSLLEILLGNCQGAAGSGPESADTEPCPLVGKLIDPNC